MASPDLSELTKAVAKRMEDKSIECPHCQKGFTLRVVPELAKETKLTVAYKLMEGHMMQAVSVGESIAAMGRLLRATAKHLGGKVEVFIIDARFKEQEIEFDFLTLEVPERKRKTPAEQPQEKLPVG